MAEEPNQVQSGAHGAAIASLVTGLASFIFASSYHYRWYNSAWGLALFSIISGVVVLRSGAPGGKVALSGLVLGTIAFCLLLLQRDAAAALLGTAMLVAGCCTGWRAR